MSNSTGAVVDNTNSIPSYTWGEDHPDTWSSWESSTPDYGTYLANEEEEPMPELGDQQQFACEVCGDYNPTTGRCCSEPCYDRWTKKNRSKLDVYYVRGLGKLPSWDSQKKLQQ